MGTTPTVTTQPVRLESYSLGTHSFSREISDRLDALGVLPDLKRGIRDTLSMLVAIHFDAPRMVTTYRWLSARLGGLGSYIQATAETISRHLHLLKTIGAIALRNAGCKGVEFRLLLLPVRKPRPEGLPSVYQGCAKAGRPFDNQDTAGQKKPESKPETPDPKPPAESRNEVSKPELQPAAEPVIEVPAPTPEPAVVELVVAAPELIVPEEVPTALVLNDEPFSVEVERAIASALVGAEPKSVLAVRERLRELFGNGQEPRRGWASYAHGLRTKLSRAEVDVINERRTKRLMAKALAEEKRRTETERAKTDVIKRQKAVVRFESLSKEERAVFAELALKALPANFRKVNPNNLMVREKLEALTFDLFQKAEALRSGPPEPSAGPLKPP